MPNAPGLASLVRTGRAVVRPVDAVAAVPSWEWRLAGGCGCGGDCGGGCGEDSRASCGCRSTIAETGASRPTPERAVLSTGTSTPSEGERVPTESWSGERPDCSIFFGPWHQMGSYCAHDELEDDDRDLIERALDVLQTWDYLIPRYELSDGVEIDTTCIQALIWGGSSYWGRLHITEDDVDARAVTTPGSTTITLKRSLLNAMVAEVNRRTCQGTCEACVVSELAGLILHEVCHTCLLTEDYAYLLGHYWRYYRQQALREVETDVPFGRGYTGSIGVGSIRREETSLCCAEEPLSSWRVDEWDADGQALSRRSRRMDFDGILFCGTS